MAEEPDPMTVLYDARLVDAFDHLPEEIDATFDEDNERHLLEAQLLQAQALEGTPVLRRRFQPLFLHLHRESPFQK